jgi:periplasmic protein CpxP/Spy
MKTKIYGVVLAGALMLSVSAFAQDQQTQAAPSGDQQQKQGQMHHGKGQHKMDPQAQLDHMTKTLNLTSDQQAKIKPILDNANQQMQSLKSDTSVQKQDRRSKAMEIHKSTMEQVRAVLTPEQQQKMDQMQQKRMARHSGKGKPGQSSTQQATPQS